MTETIKNANQGVAPSIRGLEVACRFFWEAGLPVLESEYPLYIDRIAAGLVAAGSDCADNDDEISRDFDWGPRFHVYLTQSDYSEIGTQLQSTLDKLPNHFNGICCHPSGDHVNRVYTIDGFFIEKTRNGCASGFTHAPKTPLDWLRAPEGRLFDITRGQVFYDPLGEFSERQKGFTAYYPDDAWRKRIAAALFQCVEMGPHLLVRSLARDDYHTAEAAWWSFSESAMKLGFLLTRRYAPSRKWLYREFCKLPEISVEITNLLWDGQCDVIRRPEIIEKIASVYDAKLQQLGLVQGSSSTAGEMLINHAKVISASISDPEVARLDIWVDTVVA